MEPSGLQVNGQCALASNAPGKTLSDTEDLFEAYKFETGVDTKTSRDDVLQYRGEYGQLGIAFVLTFYSCSSVVWVAE